jgi:hypothetical protein
MCKGLDIEGGAIGGPPSGRAIGSVMLLLSNGNDFCYQALQTFFITRKIGKTIMIIILPNTKGKI